ncbi:MAG: YbhB/YbcL family Raf kinase inhibitor-like protein [Candidatus Saganbacteria bacterium]|nr:YbhB/YbcL family Raf kinase inhibitor-like protein [Candidatus Saganbacteria bacterium]
MEITSPVFKNNDFLPASKLNPPLKFANVPPGANSLALIMEDPDAPFGTFDHWLVFNLPPATKGLSSGPLPAQAVSGRNTVGDTDYIPPQPPPGKAHRYIFTLYALDAVLPLKAGADKAEIEKAMAGHQLAKASLTGLFRR